MIDIQNLSYHIGKRALFENANAFIGAGQKAGLIGVNGSGKSTLLNIILGRLYPDGGAIRIQSSARIAAVEQEIADTKQTVLSYVLNCDERLKKLYAELSKNPSGVRMAEIYDKLTNLGAHSASARASAILGGLGFKNEDLQRPLKDFSGGWQRRAALAGALFIPSEILLLDEPTNHLDLETSIWLESFLEKSDKTILIISHDRNILNKVCDKIILIDECSLKIYSGNYDIYERTRTQQIEQLTKDAKRYEETRRHLQAFVDRFRYKATKAKQAQSRIKMIERMGEAPKIPVEKSISFEFPSPEPLDSYLFTLENVSCGYEDKTVLKNVDFTIAQDDKIALLGANGNGKSTLAKLLAGRLLAQSGRLTRARKIKIAYFAQNQTEEFDPEKTPFEIIKELMYEAKDTEVYTHLGRFGLQKSKADTLVEKLSGGEKSRLLLAQITIGAPHILILDEPTNHLDITSRQALMDALMDYCCALVLVTHDFNMIETVCDRLVLVDRGTISSFEGDMEDYKNYVLHSSSKEPLPERKTYENVKDKRKQNAQLRARQAPIRKQIKAVEAKLEAVTKQKDALEARLIRSYNADASIELAFFNKEIADLESKWLELTESLSNC